ncbi:hypothetical protein [Bacillus thuringiensis]|uniref:hypothetical protein n=1 Tax=Bacillus thuringiensis TaxID=1428 RepID=UPI000BF38E33|nr:hypothetical protein [Bacillus thuringiensis]PFE24907.1 hypothetical protein CN304_05160 [Bacillus thuringiensis]PFU96501.1 hypothetical protein COK93_14935 [Bacillus thuringiensis]
MLMKKISFYLTHTLFDHANINLREKSDVLGLLLNTIPDIFVDNQHDVGLGTCEIIVDKMSRIIFTLNNDGKIYKKFSFNFPFTLKENEKEQTNDMFSNKWVIFDLEGERITSQTISILKILFEDAAFVDRIHSDIEPLDFYEQILQAIKEVDLDVTISDNYIWRLIRHLYLFEPGYLRYDYDDSESRRNALTHPLHHLDFYFSNNVTLKLGIADTDRQYRDWKTDSFEALLNNNKPCYYLKLT